MDAQVWGSLHCLFWFRWFKMSCISMILSSQFIICFSRKYVYETSRSVHGIFVTGWNFPPFSLTDACLGHQEIFCAWKFDSYGHFNLGAVVFFRDTEKQRACIQNGDNICWREEKRSVRAGHLRFVVLQLEQKITFRPKWQKNWIYFWVRLLTQKWLDKNGNFIINLKYWQPQRPADRTFGRSSVIWDLA